MFGVLFFVAICAASVLLNVFLYTDKSLETLRIEYQSTVRINEMSSFEKVMPNFDKEKFLPYIDNPYVERVSFINYRFSTALIKGTEYTSPDYKMPAEILAKDPNAKPVLPPYLSVELKTKSGIKSLNDFFYNPVYVIGLSFEELNYKCVTQRRHGDCKKKPVQKALIEDLVINEILAVLTDEYIDTIAQKIAALSVTEGNTDTVKRLKRLLLENEEVTANLIKAIETGKAVDVLTAQIEKRQQERIGLETQLAQEKMIKPILTYDEVRFFFEKFKSGDANDITFRMVLADTFINRVDVFDGEDRRLEIYCNAIKQQIICPIGERLRSPMGQLVRPARFELTTY